MFDQLSFSSLRLIAIYCHFVVTSALLWTKHDCLKVGLAPYTSDSVYDKYDSVYTGLISFGLFLIVIEALFYALNHNEKSFASAMHLFMDIIAIFFNLWIMLDGLDWRTYIYIIVFCSICPLCWDVFHGIITLNKKLWVTTAIARSRPTLYSRFVKRVYKIRNWFYPAQE